MNIISLQRLYKHTYVNFNNYVPQKDEIESYNILDGTIKSINNKYVEVNFSFNSSAKKVPKCAFVNHSAFIKLLRDNDDLWQYAKIQAHFWKTKKGEKGGVVEISNLEKLLKKAEDIVLGKTKMQKFIKRVFN